TRPLPSSPLFPYTTLFRSRFTEGPSMWRAFFLAVGVTLCIWGLQCMVVERAVLVQPSEEGASGALAGFDLPGTSEPRVIEPPERSEEHTSELQSRENLVCR